jgi:hypothetical protein
MLNEGGTDHLRHGDNPSGCADRESFHMTLLDSNALGG